MSGAITFISTVTKTGRLIRKLYGEAGKHSLALTNDQKGATFQNTPWR
jgi:hypothetical protein